MRVCRFLSLAAAVLFLAVLNGAQIIKVSWSSAQDPNTPSRHFQMERIAAGRHRVEGNGCRWIWMARLRWIGLKRVFNVAIGSMPSKSKSQEMVRNGRPFLIRKVRAKVMESLLMLPKSVTGGSCALSPWGTMRTTGSICIPSGSRDFPHQEAGCTEATTSADRRGLKGFYMGGESIDRESGRGFGRSQGRSVCHPGSEAETVQPRHPSFP